MKLYKKNIYNDETYKRKCIGQIFIMMKRIKENVWE